MKTLKEKYQEYITNYAEAYKAIFEDKVEGKEYAKYSRQEKTSGKKSGEVFAMLKAQNNANQIEEFMNHENPYVRYMAAVDSLTENPTKAEKVLEDLIESKNHKIQMHALSALKIWRKIPWTEDRYKQARGSWQCIKREDISFY